MNRFDRRRSLFGVGAPIVAALAIGWLPPRDASASAIAFANLEVSVTVPSVFVLIDDAVLPAACSTTGGNCVAQADASGSSASNGILTYDASASDLGVPPFSDVAVVAAAGPGCLLAVATSTGVSHSFSAPSAFIGTLTLTYGTIGVVAGNGEAWSNFALVDETAGVTLFGKSFFTDTSFNEAASVLLPVNIPAGHVLRIDPTVGASVPEPGSLILLGLGTAGQIQLAHMRADFGGHHAHA